MLRYLFLLQILLLLLVSGCKTAGYKLAPQEELISQKNVGFLVYDLEGQKVVLEQNADEGFIPASVSKIPAIFAALNVLGPEYHFQTHLAYAGSIQGDTLTGN